MPASHGAPQAGQQAPDFTSLIPPRRSVSLSELLSTPVVEGSALPKVWLLIFYRGYW